MSIVANIPTSLYAGDSLSFVANDSLHLPSDGWRLEAAISNGSNVYTWTSSDNGDGKHLFNVLAVDTATYVAGDYYLVIAAVKGVERITQYRQALTILPNLTAANDSRSAVKQTLDALDAYLMNSSNIAAASYTIAGRTLARHSMPDLIALRNQFRKEYQQELAAMRMASGKKPRRRLLVRMAG